MPTYLTEYESELKQLGRQAFLRSYPWPVLIVFGVGGVLKGRIATGTVITEEAELVQMTALAGRVFPIVKARLSAPGPVTIGRTSDNDLAIPEYSISTRHCLLALVDGEYRLTDLGTTNGTLVDGVPLQPRKPHHLEGGETIKLGRFGLLFHLPPGFADYLTSRSSKPANEEMGPGQAR